MPCAGQPRALLGTALAHRLPPPFSAALRALGRHARPDSGKCNSRPWHWQGSVTRAASEDGSEPWEMHDDLLKQIEEQKQLHQKLMERMRLQGLQAKQDKVPPANQQDMSQHASRPQQKQPQSPTLPKVALLERQPQQQPPLAAPQPPSQSCEPEPQHTPPPPPPPLAGPNVMNVIMVGAECAPWSKTGGLGDVMGALPKALARRGHRVMAVAPRYAEYEEGWETGVRIRLGVFGQEQQVGYFHGYIDGVDWVFVDHPAYHAVRDSIYSGNNRDILFRCALLCKAALEAPWHLPCGGSVYGEDNLVFIANDWHTALLPFYLQAHYRDYNKMTYARAVLVVHNIAHQGRGPMAEIGPLEVPLQYTEHFRLYDPIGGEHMNIMKAGFLTAHRMVAVSHGYAWECQTQEGGWGLDGVLRDQSWKLRGIVNGIDYSEWSPERDTALQSDGYSNYNADTVGDGKAKCKAALQRELGLPQDPHAPLLGFIGRLDYQKGVDLIRDNFEWIMGEGCQLVLLGSGRSDLEQTLREMEASRSHQCRAWVGFNVRFAHRITAACDMLLMPSRFEPCGLNQLYAMAYGTVPIVHAVGGLRDTVQPYNPYENTGTGWTFEWADSGKFRNAMGEGIYTLREFPQSFHELRLRGMRQDMSWDNAAAQYEEVLVAAKYQW